MNLSDLRAPPVPFREGEAVESVGYPRVYQGTISWIQADYWIHVTLVGQLADALNEKERVFEPRSLKRISATELLAKVADFTAPNDER